MGFRIWLKHHWCVFQTPLEKKMKTHEANDPTCFCLTEYLQPYISPNVFTFPSMAVCVFWIYGKGKYLWHSTARLCANEQSSILLHLGMWHMILSRHLWMVNMFQSKFKSIRWSSNLDSHEVISFPEHLSKGFWDDLRGPDNVIWKKTFIWSCKQTKYFKIKIYFDG